MEIVKDNEDSKGRGRTVDKPKKKRAPKKTRVPKKASLKAKPQKEPKSEEETKENDTAVGGTEARVATVMVCAACKSPRVEARKGAGAVLGKCPNCGAKTRVTGAGLVEIAVSGNDLKKAEQLTIFPGPKGERGTGVKEETDGEFVTLNFRVATEQRDVIMKAMDGAKIMVNANGKLWKGVSLEWICADFLSGMPPEIQKRVQAEEVEDRMTAAEAEANDRLRQGELPVDGAVTEEAD